MRAHELAKQLLALPDEEVGVRAYDRSNAWPIQPPRVEAWDEMTDSNLLKGSTRKFILIETDWEQETVMAEKTLERVREVIVDLVGFVNSEVTPDADVQYDLGMDSLDRSELLIELEDEFGVEIPDAEGEKCKTVQQIVDLIDQLKP